MFGFKKKTGKVYVAMSGGVDSSVAALLLKKQGYDITGVFMRNWHAHIHDGFVGDCGWEEDERDARAVCERLGIPFLVWDFSKEYYRDVVEYFFEEYKQGRTPNPDVMCNKYIKFGTFYIRAMEAGADYVATGHYTRRRENKRTRASELLEGVDPDKDQSYFLWAITQEQLQNSLFPIGHYRKAKIRKIAQRAGLATADKHDSQGICFIGKINVRDFLKTRLPEKVGDIVTVDGKKVGTHTGVYFYTEGQRQGIGVGGTKDPYYVVAKDIEHNILTVAEGADHPMLFSKFLIAQDVHWLSLTAPELPLKTTARIRYHQNPVLPCTVSRHDNGCIKVVFDQPAWAVSVGQSVVFYDGDVCLGGGVISHKP